MRSDARNLGLRVTRRKEPDVDRLVELVLDIAETRHRAYVNGEPDPYGLPLPEPAPRKAAATNERLDPRGAHHEHHRSRHHRD
ncbi:MAG TPA: hypothetical protein VFF32_15890 [Dermatophilaceae bacterium]|nr:hypothetical protein [Dermatophilaceae bacterium]